MRGGSTLKHRDSTYTRLIQWPAKYKWFGGLLKRRPQTCHFSLVITGQYGNTNAQSVCWTGIIRHQPNIILPHPHRNASCSMHAEFHVMEEEKDNIVTFAMNPGNPADEYDRTHTSQFYEPFVVEPVKEHRQTFIILHGRGGTGESFAARFLDHPISPTQDLGRLIGLLTVRTCFPHAKFIFPTACLGLATTYWHLTHQWFDNWSPLIHPESKEELMIEGLAETSSFIHSLLQAEIDIIGAKNVVLMGLSQGCAASIISLLTWQGEPLGAAVGMCGWLPFRKDRKSVV